MMGTTTTENTNILSRFRLNDKVALVTGAGQGIGRAFAHALGEAGAWVAIVDIEADRAERVSGELESKGIRSRPICGDVTQVASIRHFVEEVVSEWGGLSVAINNAGVGLWHDSATLPQEDWDRIISVNLSGVFHCCQAEAEIMLKAGYGKIVNVASMSAHIVNTPQHQCAYNASKAGVLHLTRSLAAEWASSGVRVNSISPGYTRTQLLDNLAASPEGKEMIPQWKRMTPMGRFAEVADLQGAAVYLSSEASDFMTGQDLVVDGGYTLW